MKIMSDNIPLTLRQKIAKLTRNTNRLIEEYRTMITSYKAIVEGSQEVTSIVFPKGITRIKNNVCDYQTKVTDITIPDSVESIGGYAFSNMYALKNITLGTGVRDLDSDAFSNTMFEKLNIKSLEDFLKIDFIYSDANPISRGSQGLFLNWEKVENITIPSAITKILPFALTGCKSLKSVSIPNQVTRIAHGAFAYCSNLEEVIVGNSVTQIGTGNGEQANTGSFCDCTSLKTVSLGNKLQTIGYMAFHGCSSLSEIKIPSSVSFIHSYAFESCSSLLSVDMTDFDASSQNFHIPFLNTGVFNYTSPNKKIYFKDQATLSAFASHGQWGRYASYFEVA